MTDLKDFAIDWARIESWCELASGKAICRPVLDRVRHAAEAIEDERNALLNEQNEPHLGCATTAQLLTELQVRAEIGGYAAYRTVDGYDALNDPIDIEGKES